MITRHFNIFVLTYLHKKRNKIEENLSVIQLLHSKGRKFVGPLFNIKIHSHWSESLKMHEVLMENIELRFFANGIELIL